MVFLNYKKNNLKIYIYMYNIEYLKKNGEMALGDNFNNNPFIVVTDDTVFIGAIHKHIARKIFNQIFNDESLHNDFIEDGEDGNFYYQHLGIKCEFSQIDINSNSNSGLESSDDNILGYLRNPYIIEIDNIKKINTIIPDKNFIGEIHDIYHDDVTLEGKIKIKLYTKKKTMKEKV